MSLVVVSCLPFFSFHLLVRILILAPLVLYIMIYGKLDADYYLQILFCTVHILNNNWRILCRICMQGFFF